MNRKFRTIAVAVLLLGVAFFWGCSKEQQGNEEQEKQTIEFPYKQVFLYKGGGHSLSAIPKGFEEDATSIITNYLWESSDTTVVSVSDNGRVYAISAGEATISATYDGVTGTCSVKVSEGNDITIPSEITLKVGEIKDVGSGISSRGGCFDFRAEVEDNGYYASLPLTSPIVSQNSDVIVGQENQLNPEYKYGGLQLIGKHEGSTSLHIYITENGFDATIPVTVVP